jgi:hypothetical protein
MNVGESVRKAIDDWEHGELEAAMLHACNAVDGTAKKLIHCSAATSALHDRCARTMNTRSNGGAGN